MALTIRLMGDAASLERAYHASIVAGDKFGVGVERVNTKASASTRRLVSETEASHGRLRKSWHSASSGALGYGTALVGVGGVVEGLDKSVHAAEDAEKAQVSLETTVTNTGITWRAHSKEIENYIVTARKASGFTDADLTKSLEGFIRTTHNVDQSQSLVNESMNVARARSITLSSAQGALQKIYLGSFRALKTYGIQFTPTTAAQDKLAASTDHGNKRLKEQAKAADLVANRTRALGLVGQAYAGQSAKFADKTAGKFQKFHADLDALEVTIGTAVLPGLTKLADEGAVVATKLQAHWPEIKKDIGDVVHPIGEVVGAVVKFAEANPDLAKAAASFGLMAVAVHKIDSHTGAISLLGKVGGVLGGVTGTSTGVVGKVLGKSTGTPVYVTNWEMIRSGSGPSVPGGGGKNTVIKDAEKVGVGAIAAGAAATTAIAGTAAYLGFKGITDEDAQMNKVIEGVKNKILAANAKIEASAARMRDSVNNDLLGTGHTFTGLGNTSGKTRDKLKSDFMRMQDAGDSSLGHIRSTVKTTGANIEATMGDKTTSARIAVAKNFSLAAGAVRTSMDAGVISVKTGLKQINSYLNDELSSLGVSKASIKATGFGSDVNSLEGARGRATGGWVGQPGERGHDNVPLTLPAGYAVINHAQQLALGAGMARLGMAGGGRVIVGRGEYIAGPGEQPQLNRAARAAGFSGLDGLFATVRTPHYMAKGGKVGNLTAMESTAKAIDSKHYPYLWGGGHDAGFSPPYDCSGAVSTVLHAGGLLGAPMVSGDLMNWGLPGAGEVTVYASPAHTYMHMPDGWFGTSGSNPGGGAGFFNGAPRAGFVARHAPALDAAIKRVMFKGPGGAVGAIGQGVLDTARGAANKALRTKFASTVGGGQVGGGDPGDTATQQGRLTLGQMNTLFGSVGLPTPLFGHIGEAESGGDPGIVNSIGATGLLQIYNHPDLVKRFGPMTVPINNARAGEVLYEQSGLAPWVSSRGSWGQFAGGTHQAGLASGGFVGSEEFGPQIQGLAKRIAVNQPTLDRFDTTYGLLQRKLDQGLPPDTLVDGTPNPKYGPAKAAEDQRLTAAQNMHLTLERTQAGLIGQQRSLVVKERTQKKVKLNGLTSQRLRLSSQLAHTKDPKLKASLRKKISGIDAQLKTVRGSISSETATISDLGGQLFDARNAVTSTSLDIGDLSADRTSVLTPAASTASDTSASDTSDALAANTQALADIGAQLAADAKWRASVEGISSGQAIRALADIISGRIGGLAASRATGSAGNGVPYSYSATGRS